MIEDILVGLNREQTQAVRTTEGPLIVFAGAGTGKTRVLTRRAAYIVEKGLAKPEEVLAITFTNKAANEMKERIRALIGEKAEEMWISTFHSMCARILKDNASCVGYDDSFSIYDREDAANVFKKISKSFDEKRKDLKLIQQEIEGLKTEGVSVDDYEKRLLYSPLVLKYYKAYDEYMSMSNCMDFEDLLMKTKELLLSYPDICEEYQEKFRYILVDEYQDTNHIQFDVVKLLTGTDENICVVGDDDQGIYGFRGADVSNILDFSEEFYGCRKIKLEENYRSTQTILEAANSVISHNRERETKKLWTENPKGKPVQIRSFLNAKTEAEWMAENIKRCDCNYGDIAVLYRNNYMSRVVEESLMEKKIPYRVVGGMSFYQRKEIKDMTAYLKVITNPSDEVSLERAMGTPKRGIGQTTLEKARDYAEKNEISLFEALRRADDIPSVSAKTKDAIRDFTDFVDEWKEKMEEDGVFDREKKTKNNTVSSYLKEVLENGYLLEMEKSDVPEKVQEREDNINEFIEKVREAECEEDFYLPELLQSIALITDKGSGDETGRVSLITVHSAKGLEFKKVYMIEMNDGSFPFYRTDEMPNTEEERRLCYVGMTRAKEELTMSTVRSRKDKDGKYMYVKQSPFLSEIPTKLTDYEECDRGY